MACTARRRGRPRRCSLRPVRRVMRLGTGLVRDRSPLSATLCWRLILFWLQPGTTCAHPPVQSPMEVEPFLEVLLPAGHAEQAALGLEALPATAQNPLEQLVQAAPPRPAAQMSTAGQGNAGTST